MTVIITAEETNSWYRGRIGDTLVVYPEILNTTIPMYRMADGTRNKIRLSNCRILDLKEIFPTLSNSYT